MDKQNLIILISFLLMLSTAYSAACTAAADGQCCRIGTTNTAGQGVGANGNCAANTVDDTDMNAAKCLIGYKLVDGVCTPCEAGQTAGAATAHSETTCTNCAADQYCPLASYGTTDVAISSCPAGSTAPAGSDALIDCVCGTGQILSTTGPTCETSSLTNCITFAVGTPDTCTLCQDGFRISNQVCVACTAGCDICNSSGTNPAGSEVCTDASDGFYLKDGKGNACPPNTTTCSYDGTNVLVTGVAANFYVKTGSTTVATACDAGTSSLATAAGATAAPVATNALGCTIACSANCLNCAVNGAAQCDSCANDFILDATLKTCVALTETTRNASCATARGTLATDCLTCRDSDNRSLVKAKPEDTLGSCTCKSGYTESGITDATQPLADRSVCLKCGNGVATCKSDLTPLTCVKSTDLIVGKNCAAITDQVDGFFYDATGKQFLICDATCKTCAASGAGACTACAEIPVTTPTQEDVVTLLKVWTNGTLPATGGMCYSQCPTSYEVQDDTRVNCVAASFSYIISMISVFISFIYLI